MLGRTNAGGSGSGGTLTVTGVAGDTVTVSKDGKTYSRTFNSSGIATFKGLKSGTWTITMTDGKSTATRTVEISADYALTITYFSATINVTYPEGSSCTATDGTTTLTAPDTSGTWACVVPNAGTWTVECTDGTDTATETVTISAEGQVETVTLDYKLYFVKDGSLEGMKLSNQLRDATNGNGKPTNMAVNETSDGVVLEAEGKTNWSCGLASEIKVDVTDYTRIVCDYTTLITGAVNRIGLVSSFGVGTTSEVANLFSIASADLADNSSQSSSKLDISAVTGEYYIAIAMIIESNNSPQICIHNFYLE